MIGRNILSIDDLDRREVEKVLETAKRMQEVSFREVKKVPALRGWSVINLFFDPKMRSTPAPSNF